MSFEEKGAYMELLMAQFNRGHMTSHMCGQIVGQKLWETIKNKFVQDEDGLYYNVRLELEKTKRQQFTASRRNNLTGQNQYTKAGHKGGHMTTHMENENVNENSNKDKIGGMGEREGNAIDAEISPTFEELWNLYDHKVGKEAAKKAYKRLRQHDREAAYAKIPAYLQSLSDRKFQAHLSTWLNGRRWEDEYQEKPKKSKYELFSTPEEYARFLAVRPDGA